MSSKKLPARASLENLRKQAKGLHKAFADGDDAAVTRIQEHLPRAATLTDDALRATALSLQEAQHVLAREYGLSSWDGLRGAVETSDFEELSRLNDRETQMLMREISQKDLSRAIIGASDALRGRFLTNMSRRVRSFIVEESKTLALDLPAHEPTVSRQRILEWAETLRDNGQIHWPPNDDAQAFDGDVDLVPPTPQDDPVGEISFEELEVGEIAEIYAELTELACREGILALESWIPAGRRANALREGIRLAVDGTNPDLIADILRVRTETMSRNRRVRLQMIVEGIASLQVGDNPWIIFHKMQAHYLDPGVQQSLNRSREEITADELRDWIGRGWLTVRTPGDMAVLFLHLGFAARNGGLEALASAAQVVEWPLLKSGLEQLVAARDRAALQANLMAQMEAEISRLERHHLAANAGLLAVVAGSNPEVVTKTVTETAAS